MKELDLKLGVKKAKNPEKMSRYVLDVTPDQHKALRVLAAQNGLTLKSLILKTLGIT